jgi:hypothetical protein
VIMFRPGVRPHIGQSFGFCGKFAPTADDAA